MSATPTRVSVLTDEELRGNLITPDACGQKFKADCLAELLSRAALSSSPPGEAVAQAYANSHGRIFLNDDSPLRAIIAANPSTLIPLYAHAPPPAEGGGTVTEAMIEAAVTSDICSACLALSGPPHADCPDCMRIALTAALSRAPAGDK